MAERLALPVRPDFLIIGAQKSGTTSLAIALGRHPEIHLPEAKEAHHFGSVPDEEAGGESYRRFFSGWSGERLIGEATPEYLFNPKSARQIAAGAPDAKLIAVLRNPVDRLYSAYWHAQRAGSTYRTFEAFLEAQISARASHERMVGSNIVYGHYAIQLQRYHRLGVDPSRIQVLLFDDLVADPRAALALVQRFIGVEPLVKRLPRSNSNRSSILPPAGRRVLFRIRKRNVAVGRRIAMFTDRDHVVPRMRQFTRLGLIEYYRPHNEALAELIGRDLSAWDR